MKQDNSSCTTAAVETIRHAGHKMHNQPTARRSAQHFTKYSLETAQQKHNHAQLYNCASPSTTYEHGRRQHTTRRQPPLMYTQTTTQQAIGRHIHTLTTLSTPPQPYMLSQSVPLPGPGRPMSGSMSGCCPLPPPGRGRWKSSGRQPSRPSGSVWLS